MSLNTASVIFSNHLDKSMEYHGLDAIAAGAASEHGDIDIVPETALRRVPRVTCLALDQDIADPMIYGSPSAANTAPRSAATSSNTPFELDTKSRNPTPHGGDNAVGDEFEMGLVHRRRESPDAVTAMSNP